MPSARKFHPIVVRRRSTTGKCHGQKGSCSPDQTKLIVGSASDDMPTHFVAYAIRRSDKARCLSAGQWLRSPNCRRCRRRQMLSSPSSASIRIRGRRPSVGQQQRCVCVQSSSCTFAVVCVCVRVCRRAAATASSPVGKQAPNGDRQRAAARRSCKGRTTRCFRKRSAQRPTSLLQAKMHVCTWTWCDALTVCDETRGFFERRRFF